MTFEKYVGKKGIFAICTGGYTIWLIVGGYFDFLKFLFPEFFGSYSQLGTPFPFIMALPFIVIAWLVIIARFLTKYIKKSHKKIEQ